MGTIQHTMHGTAYDGVRALCVLVLLAPLVGCRNRNADARAAFRTRTILDSTVRLVDAAEVGAGPTAPVDDISALVSWLDMQLGADLPYVDTTRKTIADGWGREIVIIAEDGRFVGLGSKGKSGIWEDGRGDDIIVLLEDVRLR